MLTVSGWGPGFEQCARGVLQALWERDSGSSGHKTEDKSDGESVFFMNPNEQFYPISQCCCGLGSKYLHSRYQGVVGLSLFLKSTILGPQDDFINLQ